MKVLLVCSHSFKTGQTGDATQGRETAKALRKAGVEVELLFAKLYPVHIYDDADSELSSDQLLRLANSCDVIHLLPGSKPLCKFWRTFHVKPILASSIFWGGLERVWMAFANCQGPIWCKIVCAIKVARNMIPLLMNYRGVDVFLPNSNAEGRCVMQCFGTDRHTTYKAVPNGFEPPSFDIWSLPRPESVPKEDYIVVPAVFACRKNQIGLIRALKKYSRDYKIVFLGGAIDEIYHNECKYSATDNMFFLGYISSKDKEYWQILRHARVACLASDCETPGIAMIEAACAGARPVITKYGGTEEYFGKYGEYLNPCYSKSIVSAIDRGWRRGRLHRTEADSFARFTWDLVAAKTMAAYRYAIDTYGSGRKK